jgi:hypothetical protein
MNRLTDPPATIVQFQKKEEAKFICSACGADRSCNWNAPAIEKLVQKQEQDRQRAKAYRERKAEENQQPRHVTKELDPELAELRERANRLGNRIRKSGGDYVISHPDGRETGASGLAGLHYQLDVAEGKTAQRRRRDQR